MARYSRIRPVNSLKHEIIFSNLGINASAVQRTVLADAVQPASVNLVNEIEVGSVVNSVFIEINVSAQDTGVVKVINWKVQKITGNTAPTSPALGGQVDQKRILKRGMEMLPNAVSTVFKRIIVVKLPRNLRRFGIGDSLELVWVSSSTETINFCGIAVYKHYT